MVSQAKVVLDLDQVFGALAHPIRRAILEELSAGDATVSELAEPYKVSLPAISKHLRVLEDAAPLSVAFGWLTQYRVLWEDRLARLAKHLEEKKNDK